MDQSGRTRSGRANSLDLEVVMNRRKFLWYTTASGAMLTRRHELRAAQAVPGRSLNPRSVRKFQMPLVIPPAMPKTSASATSDSYEIAVRQFRQQILPAPWPATTVWSYGSANHSGSFHY